MLRETGGEQRSSADRAGNVNEGVLNGLTGYTLGHTVNGGLGIQKKVNKGEKDARRLWSQIASRRGGGEISGVNGLCRGRMATVRARVAPFGVNHRGGVWVRCRGAGPGEGKIIK